MAETAGDNWLERDLVGKLRATRAIIDLDAISDNVRALKSSLSNTARLMAVVKGNAYGHGAFQIARTALEAGAGVLGVATVAEGRSLREKGIEAPIVLLGSIEPGEVGDACRLRLEISVADDRLLEAVQAFARQPEVQTQPAVHVKVDTGLRRYGALPNFAVVLARRIHEDPYLLLAGVSTHFSSADESGDTFTLQQRMEFERTVAALAEAGVPCPARHVANSAAILIGQGTDLEMARTGISLYGVPPSDEIALLPSMRPALRLETRIARIVPISTGDTVGYNRTFRADRPMRGALLPIGYGDGYRRALAGRSWAGIHGSRADVLGRISMDQIVVRLPQSIEARPGDIVNLLSSDPLHGAPSISDLARLMESNSYELLTGIRRRIPRVYERAGSIVAVQTADAEYDLTQGKLPAATVDR